jgi:hypothetical protein
MTLLTLLWLEQGDAVPTPTKRPRLISDGIKDVTPQGHALWLRRLLLQTADDPAEVYKTLPWLMLSFTLAEDTVTWSSSDNARAIGHNKTLSFCPGAIIAGTP